MAFLAERQSRTNMVDIIQVIFLRTAALFFLYFALQYWIRLIGVHDGADFQFDTMAVHWKVAAAILAVLHPVVALGLWGLFSWGTVVWIVAIAMELTMYGFFPDMFGENRPLVIFHTVTAAMFLMILAAKRFNTNR